MVRGSTQPRDGGEPIAELLADPDRLLTAAETVRVLYPPSMRVSPAALYRLVNEGVAVERMNLKRGVAGRRVKLVCSRSPAGMAFRVRDVVAFQRELSGEPEATGNGQQAAEGGRQDEIVTPAPAKNVTRRRAPAPPSRRGRAVSCQLPAVSQAGGGVSFKRCDRSEIGTYPPARKAGGGSKRAGLADSPQLTADSRPGLRLAGVDGPSGVGGERFPGDQGQFPATG